MGLLVVSRFGVVGQLCAPVGSGDLVLFLHNEVSCFTWGVLSLS